MGGATEREANLRAQAEQLQFSVEKHGDRFTLTRTADVSRPERQSDLTLDQMEDVCAGGDSGVSEAVDGAPDQT